MNFTTSTIMIYDPSIHEANTKDCLKKVCRSLYVCSTLHTYTLQCPNLQTWVYESSPTQELVEEFYGKGSPPPLSPRSLQSFAARQAELEEYSISASGDMDSKTFDEWPRISVASRAQALAKTHKKAHAKKRRAASLGNVILPSEIERQDLSTHTKPMGCNGIVAQKVCASAALY